MDSLILEPGLEVSPAQLAAVAGGRLRLELGEAARARVAHCHAFARELIAQRRRIYGITTGYGPLAGTPIDPGLSSELQRKLVYHLCSGVGPLLPDEAVRAIMAARVVSLSQGHSAVRPQVLDLLLACLAQDLVPEVPALGTVGASGDLTPLAHIALALMGEGRLRVRGESLPAGPVLSRHGLSPLRPEGKDALALVNGVSAMTGIAALSAALARRALDWALVMSVAYTEVLGGHGDAFEAGLSRVRPHPGQQAAQQALWRLSRDSRRLRDTTDPPVLCDETQVAGPLPQDPYSARCSPQLLGAVVDMVDVHESVVTRELNAVSDNPVFFPDEGRVLHGGNFFGQQIAFAADALNNALVQMAVHAERKINRLTHPGLNGGRPAFLSGGTAGLDSGFMGAQVTATALVAELRTHALPAGIQSISTNADNQDVVSLGTIAARRTMDSLDRLYEILAIEALVLAQAMELDGLEGFADSSRELWTRVRRTSDFLAQDRPLSGDIRRVARCLKDGSPDSLS